MNQVPLTRLRNDTAVRAGLGAACLLALAGCAVGPVYRTPAPPKTDRFGPSALPASVGSAEVPGGGTQRFLPGPVPEAWWTAFGSPELDRRIQAALAHSPSLDAARASLRRSEELLRAARGAWFPAATAGAGVTRAKQSLDAGGSGTPFTLYNASVNVSYTLDLFGGIRHQVELQRAEVDAQHWLLEGASLSLAANVATATFQEASLQEQIQATEKVVTLLQEQSDLAEKQFAIGIKSQVDLLAIHAQLASAQAALAPLRLALASVRNQLAVLLGRLPSEGLPAGGSLDAYRLPGEVPITLPSDVVRRRPDVRLAETQLQAATAQVGLATADLFPHITLGGAYGSSASETGRLFKDGTTTWSLGLNLLQPIFQGGSLRARKRAAEAGLDAASASYRASVLNAFQNVSDTLNALQFDADELEAQSKAEAAAAKSLEIVKAEFRIGSVSYLQLLDATRQWQLARLGYIRARAARLSDTAALYAALGGGWREPPSRTPQPAP
ncbi:histidine kinase [Geothrix rubra]|uniref:Histidine kinase n=1 Tax=Geothrix rubra TaxID=2927977 RepID=A0ABQ5Q308_9BACT|nr:efflux transporter outer membrane subunit [Geothrix rubra]GLH68821.1 histidine kinase [Geothrix rubra]